MTGVLAGVFPVLSTPFSDDDAIDLSALATEADWLRRCGVDGLTVAMVSEVLRLTDDERRTLTTHVCRLAAATAPALPVVVSVGTSSTVTTVTLARHAETSGATAVMAIPPLGVALDDAALCDYYSQLLDAVTIPVIVQDASGYVGAAIPVGVYVTLLDGHGPDRVLAKPEAQPLGPRLSALQTATGGQLRVFEGSGGLALVDAFARGVVGTMPGPEVPWALVALWRALSEGRLVDADEIHARLAALLALQTSLDSYVTVEKHLLHAQGVLPSTRQRGPLGYHLDAQTAGLALRLLDRLRDAVELIAKEPSP
jgi:dihydrodipicolinate synthase/N-acetylneuraminate lyase